MSTISDKVRSAANPQQAMLALAEGIDALLAQQAAPAAADPWGVWDAPLPQRLDNVDMGSDMWQLAQIAATEAALAKETDGEERLALEARLRLLKEDGQSIDVLAPEGTRERTDEDAGEVIIPPATPERQASRIAWAKANGLADFSTLPEDDFLAAYGKGGPMWMYAGNRDGVMQMPYSYRVALVEDVAQDSARAAQEMSRDVLKFTDAGTHDASPLVAALQAAP